jgi:hypothetical protein
MIITIAVLPAIRKFQNTESKCPYADDTAIYLEMSVLRI